MNYLIRNNYFIGICAFVLTLCTYLVFDTATVEHLYYSLAVLFATQFIYSFLRLDKTILQPRVFKQFLQQELLPFCLTILFLILSKQSIVQFVLLGVSGLFSLVYGAHIWQVTQIISFRNNAWLKLVAIGLVWVITTVVVPFLDMSILITTKQWLYIIAMFLVIVYLTLPFELNDATTVQLHSQRKTLPLLIGKEMTAKIGRIMAITTWFLTGFVSVPAFIAMSVSVIAYLKFLNGGNVEELNTQELTLRFDGVIIVFAVVCMLLTVLGV